MTPEVEVIALHPNHDMDHTADPKDRLDSLLCSMDEVCLDDPGDRAVIAARCFKICHLCHQIGHTDGFPVEYGLSALTLIQYLRIYGQKETPNTPFDILVIAHCAAELRRLILA